MSLSVILHPLLSSPRSLPKLANPTPTGPIISPRPKFLSIRSLQRSHEHSSPKKPRLENFLSTAASLYPVYVTVGGLVACVKPSAFSWFASRGPASYSFSLAFIMLAMGLTLELKDLISLFLQKPLSILFGCVAQYTIMPAFGAIVSKFLGLPPSLSVGLILLGCCPGGTASNVAQLPMPVLLRPQRHRRRPLRFLQED